MPEREAVEDKLMLEDAVKEALEDTDTIPDADSLNVAEGEPVLKGEFEGEREAEGEGEGREEADTEGTLE